MPFKSTIVAQCSDQYYTVIFKVTGHNGHKPKRPQPKRPQTETATNRNGHKLERPKPETATDRNGHKPKRPQTETATNRNGHKPKGHKPKRPKNETAKNQNGHEPERPHKMISQYIARHVYDLRGTEYVL